MFLKFAAVFWKTVLRMKLPKKFIAALDMGTNSFHLVIAEVKKNGSFKILDREREVIRLGSELGTELYKISDSEIRKSILVLSSYKKLAETYNTNLLAFATSAVREAENKKEFISSVFEATGVKVEALDGRREAYLIYKGVEKALKLKEKNSICIDIGGGSTEIIFSEKGKIIFTESIKAGAVRLSKKFFHNFVLTKNAIKECEEYVENLLRENKLLDFNPGFEIAAGSSGTIESVAELIYLQKNDEYSRKSNGLTFSFNDLISISNQILNSPTKEERRKIKGLEPKRADIIPAGIIILKKIFELFNIKEMTVSGFALREGILIDLIKTNYPFQISQKFK